MGPFRGVILINKQSSDPFEELPMIHEPLRHFVLHSEDILKAHFGSSNNLLEYYSHAERRVFGHSFEGFLSEFFGHARDRPLFDIFKTLDDFLNGV